MAPLQVLVILCQIVNSEDERVVEYALLSTEVILLLPDYCVD